MLKHTRNLLFILSAMILTAGCSHLNSNAIRYRLMYIADELFSQSTVTVPVFVTSTPTPTQTPIPSATPTPTETLTPIPTIRIMEYASPTFEVLSTAEMPLSAKDEISKVSDISVQDDVILEPNQLFIKSWRMTNSGENTWLDGVKLMMEPNYDMDMPTVVRAVFIKPNDWIDFTPGGWGNRVYNVAPGMETDLAVILKAPATAGTYQIHFRLVNTDGEIITTPFWMRFAVARPTQTPTPAPTSETPEPEVIPYDWNGRWMVREPFHTDEIIPANAWLEQNGEEVVGFIYGSDGYPIIVKGAVSDNGRVFNGELYYPWQKETTPVSWRMQQSRNQFHAVTPLGTLDDAAVCGGRDGYNFPESCALPDNG